MTKTVRVLNVQVQNCLDCPFAIDQRLDVELEGGGKVRAGYYCLMEGRRAGEMRALFLHRWLDDLPEIHTFKEMMLHTYGDVVADFCPLPKVEIKTSVSGRRKLEIT